MAKQATKTKYQTELLALFARLTPQERKRYYETVQGVMKRNVTSDSLVTLVATIAGHGLKRKWKPDSCFKKCFIPPFTGGAEVVYEQLAASLDIFDELFGAK